VLFTACICVCLCVVRWFVRLFLEGEIYSLLRSIRKYLRHRPHTITDETCANVAIENLVDVFQERKIDSKSTIELIWMSDRSFLLNEMLQCVKKPGHQHLIQIWPSLRI